MIQQTLVEELHFIHDHIEGLEQRLDRLIANSNQWSEGVGRDTVLNTIELRVDGINEELRALNVLIRQMVKIFDRMAFMVDKSLEDPHPDDRGQRVR